MKVLNFVHCEGQTCLAFLVIQVADGRHRDSWVLGGGAGALDPLIDSHEGPELGGGLDSISD